ncbi:MAG: hypothetical protein QM692_12520 [Thermomicrobiales bacterium]
MALPFSRGSVVLLDACSLINLYATGYLPEILAMVPARCVVTDVVMGEALFLRRHDKEGVADERVPIRLQPLLDTGLLSVVSSEDDDELLTYIDLTAEVDPGEAMTIALAVHRGWHVMTDDRKARRVVNERGIACVSSLELVRHWSAGSAISDAVLRGALQAIQQQARWKPGRVHPLADWWEQVLIEDA